MSAGSIGPWHRSPRNPLRIVDRRTTVCTVAERGPFGRENAEQAAQLIAAAPRLARAAEVVDRLVIDGQLEGDASVTAALFELRAALREAGL